MAPVFCLLISQGPSGTCWRSQCCFRRRCLHGINSRSLPSKLYYVSLSIHTVFSDSVTNSVSFGEESEEFKTVRTFVSSTSGQVIWCPAWELWAVFSCSCWSLVVRLTDADPQSALSQAWQTLCIS